MGWRGGGEGGCGWYGGAVGVLVCCGVERVGLEVDVRLLQIEGNMVAV